MQRREPDETQAVLRALADPTRRWIARRYKRDLRSIDNLYKYGSPYTPWG